MSERATIKPDIYLGWAKNAVAERMLQTPRYVILNARCRDVEQVWNRLLQVEVQKVQLMTGELLPGDIVPYADYSEAEDYLHHRALWFATELAWGDRG